MNNRSSDGQPLISLIVATLGSRPAELVRLLNSLRAQNARNFEIIVVDQSASGLDHLLAAYPEVIHVRSNRRGLSRNRNIGLTRARGQLIAFPDDDCVLPATYIAEINRGAGQLQGRRLFAFGDTLRLEDHKPFHPLYRPGSIQRTNRWNCILVNSVVLVLHRACFDAVGCFDEAFGVGSTYGAGEEVDLMLRLLDAGIDSWYWPNLIVLHPAPPEVRNAEARHQSYAYSIGALARKHWRLSRNWQFMSIFLYSLSRSFGALVIARLQRDPAAAYFAANLSAKWRGFMEYRPHGAHHAFEYRA